MRNRHFGKAIYGRSNHPNAVLSSFISDLLLPQQPSPNLELDGHICTYIWTTRCSILRECSKKLSEYPICRLPWQQQLLGKMQAAWEPKSLANAAAACRVKTNFEFHPQQQQQQSLPFNLSFLRRRFSLSLQQIHHFFFSPAAPS